MEIKDATATREVFDAWTAARLAKCIDEAQRAKITERQYPRTTAQAVAELRFRGFDATEERAEHFAEQIGVEKFGNALAWYRSDVDEFADILEGRNMLRLGTRHRIMRNITWSQDNAD